MHGRIDHLIQAHTHTIYRVKEYNKYNWHHEWPNAEVFAPLSNQTIQFFASVHFEVRHNLLPLFYRSNSDFTPFIFNCMVSRLRSSAIGRIENG